MTIRKAQRNENISTLRKVGEPDQENPEKYGTGEVYLNT
jgi:hypothetical protein